MRRRVQESVGSPFMVSGTRLSFCGFALFPHFFFPPRLNGCGFCDKRAGEGGGGADRVARRPEIGTKKSDGLSEVHLLSEKNRNGLLGRQGQRRRSRPDLTRRNTFDQGCAWQNVQRCSSVCPGGIPHIAGNSGRADV